MRLLALISVSRETGLLRGSPLAMVHPLLVSSSFDRTSVGHNQVIGNETKLDPPEETARRNKTEICVT
jgi:hypothetical protein